jgi:Peptidase family S41
MTRPAARVAIAVLLVAGCGPTEQDATGTVPSASIDPAATAAPSTTGAATAVAGPKANWAEDMETLATFMRVFHPDPFWRVSEAVFDAELAAAPGRLAAMDGVEATVEVMRLAALIDGHTGVYPFEAGFGLYTMRFYLFPDGIHVVAADDPELVGARVTSIGGTPIDEAMERVRPYASHDNEATIDLVVPMLLMTPEVLVATGIVDDADRPGFELETVAGDRARVDPPIVDWDTFIARNDGAPLGLPKLPEPLSLSRRDEPFWWTTLPGPDGPVLYLQYNQVRPTSGELTIQDAADAVVAGLDDGATRVVVDLRHNPGGDNTTYGALLGILQEDRRVNRPGGMFVIIGRQTFSAAMNFATELDTSTDAVFVGEPTGGSPNLYGDVRPAVLPNSGIRVEISSRYWPLGGPDDDRPWIAPDIPVAVTVDDLLVGRDPVLQAALDAAP